MMSTESLIAMFFIGALLWGGLIVLIVIALGRENKKRSG
jgi:RsiW-degrading membrane proteinase PrsW (M82 family)